MKISQLVLGYNRPKHLFKVLSSISKFSKDSNINLYLDGPKNDRDKEAQLKILEFRKYFVNLNLNIYPNSENLGLKNSVTRAINLEFTSCDAIIVIEDDCVINKNFFEYMSWGLQKFRKTERVMSINGYQIPEISEDSSISTPFFAQRFVPWGWATWKDRWQLLPTEEIQFKHLVETAKKFNIVPSDLKATLFNHENLARKDAWSPVWHLAHYGTKSLVLQPPESLVSNIGFDGTGVHSLKTNQFSLIRSSMDESLQWIKKLNNITVEFDKSLSNRVDFFFNDKWHKTINMHVLD